MHSWLYLSNRVDPTFKLTPPLLPRNELPVERLKFTEALLDSPVWREIFPLEPLSEESPDLMKTFPEPRASMLPSPEVMMALPPFEEELPPEPAVRKISPPGPPEAEPASIDIQPPPLILPPPSRTPAPCPAFYLILFPTGP